jgi:hypothetical protein
VLVAQTAATAIAVRATKCFKFLSS